MSDPTNENHVSPPEEERSDEEEDFSDEQEGRGGPSFFNFLGALPAFVIAVVLVGIPIAAGLRTSTRARYEWWAERHLQRREYPALSVCLKRLLTLDPRRPEVNFVLVQVYEGLGEITKAETLARALAPLDEIGYEPARRWLIVRGLNQPESALSAADSQVAEPRQGDPAGGLAANDPTPQLQGDADAAAILGRIKALGSKSRSAAQAQLERLLEEHPESVEVKMTLGMIYAESGRYKDACQLLEPVSNGRPMIQLALARCHLALNDRQAWSRYVKAARDSSERIMTERPDDPAARSVVIATCLAESDYEGALKLLSKHGTRATAEARARESALVCASWADSLNRTGRAKPSELVAVVRRGLEYDPRNEALLTDLAGLLLAREAPLAREAHAAVEGMIVRGGRLAAPAEYALGMEAWARGRYPEARRRWLLCHELDADVPLVANNLASSLLTVPPSQPARALAVIDGALSKARHDPRLRLTRGQILIKLARWKEAAAELEKARAGGQDGEELRESLKEVHRHLETSPEHKKGRPPVR